MLAVWLRDLVISLAISAFIIVFLYQPVKVEGTSMMPLPRRPGKDFRQQVRLPLGADRARRYRGVPVSAGSIDELHQTSDRVAGDVIRIDAGQVYVNGEPLEEDYVPPIYADERPYPETVVPPHSYFMLGDHRSMSKDSRDFGPVKESLIYGKAVFGYWPMDKLGRLR